MANIIRALFDILLTPFLLLFTLVEAGVVAVFGASAWIYHRWWVWAIAGFYTALLVIVPLGTLILGAAMLLGGAYVGSDWTVLGGFLVLCAGSVLTFLLLLPGLLLFSGIAAVLRGAVYGVDLGLNEVLRPWRWLWTPRAARVVTTTTTAATAAPARAR